MITPVSCTTDQLLSQGKGFSIKGIVSVISSDPPCKDDNVRLRNSSHQSNLSVPVSIK